MNLGQRGALEGVDQRHAVAVAVALDVEGGAPGGAGGEHLAGAALRRPGIAAEHAAEVVAQVAQQRFVVRQAKVLTGQLLPLRRRAQPGRHAVGLLMAEGGQDTFFGRHCHGELRHLPYERRNAVRENGCIDRRPGQARTGISEGSCP